MLETCALLGSRLNSLHLTTILRVQAMATAAPEQLQRAIRQPVEQLLSGNQAEDKSRTCAALELLFGLMASGKIFGPQGGVSVPPGAPDINRPAWGVTAAMCYQQPVGMSWACVKRPLSCSTGARLSMHTL